jgi:hypothetical protein
VLGVHPAGGARVWQQRKDTPANRRAVAECLAGIDALLDMYLDSRLGPAHRPLDPRPRRPAEAAL